MGTQTMPIVVGNICFPSHKSEKLDRSNKRGNTTGVSSAVTWILLSADTGLYCTKFITKLSPRCFSSIGDRQSKENWFNLSSLVNVSLEKIFQTSSEIHRSCSHFWLLFRFQPSLWFSDLLFSFFKLNLKHLSNSNETITE